MHVRSWSNSQRIQTHDRTLPHTNAQDGPRFPVTDLPRASLVLGLLLPPRVSLSSFGLKDHYTIILNRVQKQYVLPTLAADAWP